MSFWDAIHWLLFKPDFKRGDAVHVRGIRGVVIKRLEKSVLIRMYDGAKVEADLKSVRHVGDEE